ncbi:hypothetical protein HK100_008636, partial [Physocladia obscura]
MLASGVLYGLGGYSFGVKEAQVEEDTSAAARQARLQADYALTGMRQSVEAVLLVHEHGHPHVLMLQINNAFFKLPGDALRPGEDHVGGLQRALSEKLAPPANPSDPSSKATEHVDWEIADLLGCWFRPTFEQFM